MQLLVDPTLSSMDLACSSMDPAYSSMGQAYSSVNPAYSSTGPALSLKYHLSLTVILIVVFRFLVDSYSTQTTGALSPGLS